MHNHSLTTVAKGTAAAAAAAAAADHRCPFILLDTDTNTNKIHNGTEKGLCMLNTVRKDNTDN